MNNKKQLLLSIGLVLILVLMIVGISYAAFQFIGQGSKVSTITSGIMKMSYTESDNIINLQGALPTTDETGKKRLTEGEYFDFTVSSTIQGSSNINWEIALAPIELENMFDPGFIKMYLTELDDDGNETPVVEPTIFMNLDMEANKYTGKPAMVEGTENTTQIPIFTLYSTSADKSFNKKYRLRMWVDEEYNPQDDGGNLQFGVKVNVYGKTFIPRTGSVADVLLAGVGDNGTIDTTDSEQTFITGENPDNYIWYSGKLWRAVSIDPSDNSVKIITQQIAGLKASTATGPDFKGSDMEQWLNDTSVDGFLGNLREPDKFIKKDSVWNATFARETTKPEKTTLVTDAVGTLNLYEYTMSYKNTTYENGYLREDTYWWLLTPCGEDNHQIAHVESSGYTEIDGPTYSYGIRPAVNLKPTVKVVNGEGTIYNPYRLEGDNDNPTNVLLSTRYSGEYISFGTEEHDLYRIVSHENGTGTKIVSNYYIDGVAFDANKSNLFSKDTTLGSFLNGEFLTSGEYLTAEQVNMIEDNTTWYLGAVTETNYKLAKYQDTTGSSLTTATTTAKVGLLRFGELMSAPLYRNSTLTPRDDRNKMVNAGTGNEVFLAEKNVKHFPAMNLKSNVIITGGKGTAQEPFTIKLGS